MTRAFRRRQRDEIHTFVRRHIRPRLARRSNKYYLPACAAPAIVRAMVRSETAVVVDRSSQCCSPSAVRILGASNIAPTHVDPATVCMRLNTKFKVVQGTVPHSNTTADFHPGVPSQLCPFQFDGCLAD